MTQARVGIPVPVVYGGIALVIGLLVAVGFLAGRASTAIGDAAPVTVIAEPTHGAHFDGRSETPVAATAGDVPAPTEGGPVPAAPLSALPILPASSPAPVDSVATIPPPAPASEIAEYFHHMDAVQGAVKTWSDPTALAQEVLAQAMRGDSGGFDKLIAASALARDGVRTMAVPAPCAEHHRLTLGLLGEAVVILTRLREGVAAGDPSALAGIATSGSALEARARAVDVLGASLRSQYGVAAAQ